MKLSKILLGSAFAVSTVAIPVTTLTSCGTTWGVLTPFSIGGTTLSDGPFNELSDEFSEAQDADGKTILPYLQSNYSVDVKNGTNYAYATPMKWNDEAKEWNTPGSSGWYTSTDEAFASTHSYDDGDKTVTKTCAQNATLSANTDFVTTIGSTIKTYLEAALNYQGSQAKIVKKDGKDIGDDSNMKIAWGSEKQFVLNHGTLMDKTNEQNAQFFEYVFANANMNSSGASKATFRTMSVAFQFESMFLPTYDFTGQRELSEDFKGLIAGDDGQYWSEETDVDDPDIEGLKFKRQIYKSVPVIVRVTGIKQTYLNASNKKGSFLVSDYYSSSKDVSDSIKDSWKKTLPAFTNQDKDQAVPHYKTYEITTGNGITFGTKDERVGQVQGCDFIALVDYVVNDYTGTEHAEKTTAQISKLANFFPAYLLDLYPNDMYTTAAGEGTKTIIDSSKVDEKTSQLLQLLNRTSKEGMKAEAKDLNQESKNLLSFLGYMFAGTNKTINTTQVFKPKPL